MSLTAPWLLEFKRRANHREWLSTKRRPPRNTWILEIKHKVRLWRERCVLRAPKSAYWPVISSSKGIVNQVDQCRPSQKYQKEKKQKRAYTTAKTAKPTVGKLSDLFGFKGQQYLLLKDQYSRFPVIRRLTSTVINHPKNIFAERSISMKLMTDNGPVSSAEFKRFNLWTSMEWSTILVPIV